MKYIWKCKCEIGSSERVKKNFKSFEEANQYVREIISKHVDISSYIDELKSYGNYKYFLDRADFLTKYIEDTSFPHSKDDFPLEKPEDYDDDPSLKPKSKEGIEIIEAFEFSEKRICLVEYNENPFFDFMSDFVLPNSYSFCNKEMRVSFEGRLDITVTMQEDWEPSSYPIMVLKVLQDTNEPLLQKEIGNRVEWRFFYDYDFYDREKNHLHRNIIGRIIKMLKDLGFPITRSKEGYLLDKSCMNESLSIKEGSFGSKANSVMVLLVLQSADTPLTREDIVKKIKERFHHDIEVKTVGRKVEMLKEEFKYKIKKFGNKGYLLQK